METTQIHTNINSLAIKKHLHVWKEDKNFLRCECGKHKLLLTKKGSTDISTAIKSDGRQYTVRANRDRIFNPNEWKLFMQQCSEKQQFTFKFLLLTGARINEAINVKVEDIDINNQRIVLRVTKQRHGDNVINKSKTRVIRVSKELISDIKKQIRDNNLSKENYLGILSQPAAHIAMRGYKDKKGALQLANIKDYEMLSVHSIRKTSENWALAIGIDSMSLSKRFGHNIVTQYEHYSQSDAFTPQEKEYIRQYYGDTFIN